MDFVIDKQTEQIEDYVEVDVNGDHVFVTIAGDVCVGCPDRAGQWGS